MARRQVWEVWHRVRSLGPRHGTWRGLSAAWALSLAVCVLLLASCGAAASGDGANGVNGATQASPTRTRALVGSTIVTPSPTATPTVAPTPTPLPTATPAFTPAPLPRLAPTATARPHPTATPRPRATATLRSRPVPTPTAPPATAAITFTCAQAVDHAYGRVCVHTAPGAALTIVVRYCSGYRAVSHSLRGTSYADGSGNHTWTWTPDTKCRGPATATVTASLHGASVAAVKSFVVG